MTVRTKCGFRNFIEISLIECLLLDPGRMGGVIGGIERVGLPGMNRLAINRDENDKI
jgi:hypothetical protein